MFSKFHVRKVGVVLALAAVISGGTIADANHSWSNYHWARMSSSFTLRLDDNLGTAWKPYLVTASSEWSTSSVLDTTIVLSTNSTCLATRGRVEVCNSTYGSNGWLGVAQIWISKSHITQGVVKLNDTYFNSTHNTPAWRSLVMCQEVGHIFGLDHQDENFSNPNLGTCMDYTNIPNGPPQNVSPNAHDYDQLVSIYSHRDKITTVGQVVLSGSTNATGADVAEWGKSVKKDSRGKTSLFERDLGNGEKLLTFVIWVE